VFLGTKSKRFEWFVLDFEQPKVNISRREKQNNLMNWINFYKYKNLYVLL